MIFSQFLIGFHVWYVLYLVSLRVQQLMWLKCCLIIGSVSLAVLRKLFLTEIHGLLACFGHSWLSFWVVNLHFLLLIIPRLMVWVRGFTDQLRKWWEATWGWSRMIGIYVCLNVSLLSTTVCTVVLKSHLLKLCLDLLLSFHWIWLLSSCRIIRCRRLIRCWEIDLMFSSLWSRTSWKVRLPCKSRLTNTGGTSHLLLGIWSG